MAKALKIVGAVAAVAGLAIVTGGAALGLGLSLATSVAGISAGALIAGGAVLSTAGSLLSPRPKAPSVSAATTDRLQVSVELRAPRKMIFGRTAMATDLRDQEVSADQSLVDRFITVASHRVNAIQEVWFDDKMAWTSAGGVQGDYGGYLTVQTVLEGSGANAINIGPRMGSSRRYTGCAYVHLRFKTMGNGKKAESPFAASIPTRVTIVGEGALVYDPRRDDTVPGGSGPQRADDQATWAWDEGGSRNTALVMLWYLLGWRIRNPVTGAMKLAVGKGLPAARIDLASFLTAANLCDEPVARSAGGTEPRYRCDGIASEGDDTSTVLDQLKATMNAVLDDVDGKIRLTVLHNDLAMPIGTLTADDVIGEFSWLQTPPLTDSINVIRGAYVDPSSASLYQLVDYPEVRIDSPDGIDRPQPITLALVQSPSQAQRLVKQRLQRLQYGGTFTAVFQASAWKYQKGDVVRLTFYPLGFDAKLFRIADMAIQVDGLVPMMLREEHPEIYSWDASDAAPVTSADPTIYDPRLWPIVQGIGEAAATADWDGVTGAGKPDDNATVGAPVGTPVGDRTAEDVLHDLDINVSSILSQALRLDDMLTTFDVRTLVEGQPVGPFFLDFKQMQDEVNSRVASNFRLIGVRSMDGLGWVLDLETVQVGGGQTLAQRLEQVAASAGDSTATVTLLREALVTEDGGLAKTILRADADGVFGAFEITANGVQRLARVRIVGDEFEFVDPDGGKPIRPFSIVDGKVRATDFEADTITYGALVSRFGGVNSKLDPAGGFQKVPSGLIHQWGQYRQAGMTQANAIAVTFEEPFPNALMSVTAMPFINNASTSNRGVFMQSTSSRNNAMCTFQPQAQSGSVSIDGFDWMAFGY